MVEIYESEQEQIDALKTWWSENAVSVIAGVVIGIGGLVSWQGWQGYNQSRQEAASSQYMQIMEHVNESHFDAVPGIADGIVAEYDETHYASLAQLAAARANVEAGNKDSAATRLQWVVDNASTSSFTLIARLRLATLLLSQGNLEQAKSTLDVRFPESFGARLNELLGDIAIAENDTITARIAYDKALKSQPAPTNQQVLQMKRDDLGNVDLLDS
jgi:predicted negative regulator of RcsB-dependent stress response